MGMSGVDSGVTPLLQGRNGALNFEAKNACYTAGATLLAISGSDSALGDDSDNSSKSTQRAVDDSIFACRLTTLVRKEEGMVHYLHSWTQHHPYEEMI